MSETVSLVVITRDRPATLARLLVALARQTVRPGEIVVVDNGTTEGTRTLLGEGRWDLPLRLEREVRPGVARARNCGVRAARLPIIAFLDDDCVPCPRWLETVALAFAQDPALDAVQGRTLQASRSWSVTAEMHQAEWDRWVGEMLARTPGRVGTLNTNNCAIRASLLESFDPPFDERVVSSEDIDLFFKLRGQGVEVHYLEPMLVTHHLDQDLRQFLRRWHWYGRGKGHAKQLHWSSADAYSQSYFEQTGGIRVLLAGLWADVHKPWVAPFFRELLSQSRLPDALAFYPLLLAQRTAFRWGLQRGSRERLPAG